MNIFVIFILTQYSLLNIHIRSILFAEYSYSLESKNSRIHNSPKWKCTYRLKGGAAASQANFLTRQAENRAGMKTNLLLRTIFAELATEIVYISHLYGPAKQACTQASTFFNPPTPTLWLARDGSGRVLGGSSLVGQEKVPSGFRARAGLESIPMSGKTAAASRKPVEENMNVHRRLRQGGGCEPNRLYDTDLAQFAESNTLNNQKFHRLVAKATLRG